MIKCACAYQLVYESGGEDTDPLNLEEVLTLWLPVEAAPDGDDEGSGEDYNATAFDYALHDHLFLKYAGVGVLPADIHKASLKASEKALLKNLGMKSTGTLDTKFSESSGLDDDDAFLCFILKYTNGQFF